MMLIGRSSRRENLATVESAQAETSRLRHRSVTTSSCYRTKRNKLIPRNVAHARMVSLHAFHLDCERLGVARRSFRSRGRPKKQFESSVSPLGTPQLRRRLTTVNQIS